MRGKEPERGVAALRRAEGDTVGTCSKAFERVVAQRLGFRQETNLPREKNLRNDEIMLGDSMKARLPFLPGLRVCATIKGPIPPFVRRESMESNPCGAPHYGPFLERIRERIPQDRLLLNAPMREHTTLKIGGPADLLITAQSAEEIAFLIRLASEYGVPMMMLGNGSNLLVRDGGIRGLVVRMGEAMAEITVEGTRLTAKAGASLAAVTKEAARHSLAGLCFACGIPGTVGGGVYMNAGAYGGELKEAVLRVEAVSESGKILFFTGEQMHFGYRHSLAQEENLIITSVTFQLAPGDRETILSDMREFNRRRNEKQPMDVPSAGSTFKRPEGHYAGQLIDQAGLRGTRVGAAQVSEKHAGFLVNTGNATAAEYLALIALVQRVVFEKSGVSLAPEVRIVGEDTPVHLV